MDDKPSIPGDLFAFVFETAISSSERVIRLLSEFKSASLSLLWILSKKYLIENRYQLYFSQALLISSKNQTSSAKSQQRH